MKKQLKISLIFLLSLFSSAQVMAFQTCHVTAKSGDGPGSLPWQVERANQGECDQIVFTTMTAPLQVTITEPLIFSADYEVMVSGANYGSGEDLASLGVVIDVRQVDGCAFLIEDPTSVSVRYLSILVQNFGTALCDDEERPFLRQGHSAYIGDDAVDTYYPFLQICEGNELSQLCTQAPLPALAQPTVGSGDKAIPPPPPPDPHPEPGPTTVRPQDFYNCSDKDQDQLCDEVDLCDLSEDNPQATSLEEVMAEQCPELLLGEPGNSILCSQSADLDGDKKGNACDSDADGDGFANSVEEDWGTDPLNKNSFPQPAAEEEDPESNKEPEATKDPEKETDSSSDSSNEDEEKQIIHASCSLKNPTSQTKQTTGLGLLAFGFGVFLLSSKRWQLALDKQ